MSWHFSQALEAGFSAASSSGGEPCAPWKSMPSAPDDSCSAKMKATFHRSPFGMMFVPSTDGPGAALLTWFLEAFRARTSAQPGKERASTGNAQGCGRSSLASLAKYNPDTRSWKTPQCSLLPGGGLEEFSGIWPRWGSMRDGECWELALLAYHTHGNGCSLWPTPTRSMGKRGWGIGSGRFRTTGHLRFGARASENMRKDISMYGWKLNPFALEWLMWWPSGWTGSKPLATAKFRQWCGSHGRR